jgi:hypothetical protein
MTNTYYWFIFLFIFIIMSLVWLRFESYNINKIPEKRPRMDLREADLKKKVGYLE